jgi:hypothetical protein
MNNKKPDYEVANEEAKALFDKLGIKYTISDPFPMVRDEDWPCIAYHISFQHQHNGKILTSEYHLGVGHVDWQKYRGGSLMMPGLTQVQENIIYAHQNQKFGGPTFKKEFKLDEAKAATCLAKRQKVQPKAYEVFASVCREAWEASQETFDDWASNFGYDTDSRKAEQLYHACKAPFGTLIGMIGSTDVEKFAQLAQQF